LPLRDIVVFPHVIVPLFVGREKSICALEEVMKSDTFILLATQKNASDDDPATEASQTSIRITRGSLQCQDQTGCALQLQRVLSSVPSPTLR